MKKLDPNFGNNKDILLHNDRLLRSISKKNYFNKGDPE